MADNFTFSDGAPATTPASTQAISQQSGVSLPALTGDVLQDTINALLYERLQVIRLGPKVTYEIDGHSVDWNTWLRDLDKRVDSALKQAAQLQSWELWGQGL